MKVRAIFIVLVSLLGTSIAFGADSSMSIMTRVYAENQVLNVLKYSEVIVGRTCSLMKTTVIYFKGLIARILICIQVKP